MNRTILLFVWLAHFVGVVVTAESGNNCDQVCSAGTYLSKEHATINCTFACVRCPPKSMTNSTDAIECMNCTKGYVSNPQRTLCSPYQKRSYNLARPMGIIYFILMVSVIVLILVAFVIFTKNREHELVLLSGYEGLCLFLFGCLVIVVSPIPLLMEPIQKVCCIYVVAFNVGLTLIFSVLVTRSSCVSSFYNEENEVVKSGLGSSPRIIVCTLILLVQIVILAVGFTVSPLETLVIETSQWNYGYWECSIWASYVFWIGFFYNILLSCVGNFMSCSSTKMDDICEELKYVILSYLLFYLLALIEVILFFRARNEALAEGQAIMCVLYALSFLVFYVKPKIHVILYRTQEDGKTIKGNLHVNDNEAAVTSLIHAKGGYQHRVVAMKVRDADT